MRQMIRLMSYGALLVLLGGVAAVQAADDDREASEICAMCHDTVAAELDMTVPRRKKQSFGLMLALRPWTYWDILEPSTPSLTPPGQRPDERGGHR